jgi:hypothetical protein
MKKQEDIMLQFQSTNITKEGWIKWSLSQEPIKFHADNWLSCYIFNIHSGQLVS